MSPRLTDASIRFTLRGDLPALPDDSICNAGNPILPRENIKYTAAPANYPMLHTVKKLPDLKFRDIQRQYSSSIVENIAANRMIRGIQPDVRLQRTLLIAVVETQP